MKTTAVQMKLMVFGLCLLLVNSSSGFSQTTRTTKSDGLWSNPNTWTGGVIPDASNKAAINNHVIIDMDVNILSLTISAPSSLTFDTLSVHVFTVADEIVVNGLFTVARNKISPLKHIVEVGADFYGSGSIDFYDPNGDVVELVFIGNSNSTVKDITDITGVGGNGKFGGLKVEKSITGAVVTFKKSIHINSGTSPSLQSNVTVIKGVLDFDSSYVSAGDNINILQVDSLGKLYMGSLHIHSGDGFEQYIIHPRSTVMFYESGDYEMTKGWTTFNGEFGNFIVSGSGIKYFGDSVVSRTILGNFTVDAGANYNVNNDSVVVHGLATINGTLSSDNKYCYIVFDSLAKVSDNAAWLATMNDEFVFKNGLNVSKNADFSGGTGYYIFTVNNQEIVLYDTIQNIRVDNILLSNKDSLTCNVLQGTGMLINNFTLDFTGQDIECNLNLNPANNIVIYSNNNPMISPLNYENIRIKGSGTSSLAGEVLVKKSLEKENDGYISLGNYNVTLDTSAILQFDDPGDTRMIVTGGTGSFVVRSKISGRFMMVYPVGTLSDTAAYTPFEITNMINHPGGVKYMSVKAVHGHHPGMEDTNGLLKYWTIETDMLPTDSISADIKFLYHNNELSGNENNYEVRCWTGNKPWIEPENWSIDAVQNEITVSGVNDISLDWTAGDSTAITSKIDDLVYNIESGTYYNAQLLSITTSIPGVKIYYNLNGTMPDTSNSLYGDPIAIDTAVILSSIAFKEGWQNSDVKTASYLFRVDTVKFSIPSGTYTGEQYIELTSNTLDAEIRYTLDGIDPDELSTLYTSPLEIDTTTVIKAIGYKDKYQASVMSVAIYSIIITSAPQEMGDKTDIFIYPVPATSSVKIEFKNTAAQEVKLSIFNIAGTPVYTDYFRSNSVVELNLENLKPGVYFLIMDTGDNQITRKLIKQ